MKSERFWKLIAISVVLLVAAGVAAAVNLTSLNSDETLGVVASSSHVDKDPKMSTEVAAKIPPSGIAPPAELMTVNIYLNTNKTEDFEELQNHTTEILRIKGSRIVATIYTSEILEILDLPFVSYMDTPLKAQLFSGVAVSASEPDKNPKMSTEVADSIPPPGVAPPAEPMIVNVYVTENKTEEITELENHTTKILYTKGNRMVAEIYTKDIVNIVDLPIVSYLDKPLKTQLFREPAIDEGVQCIGADKLHSMGITGKGVKVAIVDHGFAKYQECQAAGALPPTLTVKSFREDGDITGGGIVLHGTGCAGVVHKVAPDAELYLINYDGYDFQLEEIVDYVVSEGMDIISHSCGREAGLFDGTDYDSQIINNAVFNHGIIWVNAAGNSADEHWEGIFNDTDGDGFHEFQDGELAQTFYANEGEFVLVRLSWNDTWDYAVQDYELYVVDSEANIVAGSVNPQDGSFGHVPIEFCGGLAPYTDTYSIVIANYNATIPVHFELYTHTPHEDLYYYVPESSLCVEATASGSITVGAVSSEDCSTLASYSSQGPTNDGRIKPDFVGPTDVSSCAYSPETFGGTSAATPHIAGAFALILSDIKSSGQVEGQSAFDLILPTLNQIANTTQQDNLFGYGLLNFGD